MRNRTALKLVVFTTSLAHADAPQERQHYNDARRAIMANRELAKVVPKLEKGFIEGCRLLERKAIMLAALDRTAGRERVRLAYQIQRIESAISINKVHNGALTSQAAERLGLTAADDETQDLMSFLQEVETCYCPSESDDRVIFGACTSIKAPKH